MEKIRFGKVKKANKKIRSIKRIFLFGGERGIRTPVTVFAVNMISNHAPSTTRTPLHDVSALAHSIARSEQYLHIV